ncbi:MAG TPA: hypothetical protein VF323_13175 [Candidatus Limnocylindrales bacterium]
MDGSLLILLLVLVGFLALGLAALAGGVDSREFDTRCSPASTFAEGD